MPQRVLRVIWAVEEKDRGTGPQAHAPPMRINIRSRAHLTHLWAPNTKEC